MSNPRIPRKPGQPANSKKHSDLYTDENPKGTIHGLGFKDVATAKASVSKIRNSSRSHAHKIQAAVAMEQRAREMGKTSEAAVYRKFINSMKKKTKEMNEEMNGKCKVGYYYCYTDKKCKPIPKGFKVVGRMGYLRKENGHSVDDTPKNGNGNGGNGNGNGGNGNGNSGNGNGGNGGSVSEEGLRDWFGKSSGTTKSGRKVGGWVQVGGKYDGKPCARQPGQKSTPKCVSSSKRRSMSKDERDSAARRKRAADPNQPQKSGAAKPTNVPTDPKRKMKESFVNEAKDKKGKGSGTKDACYHKVKSRYSVWPSAYASGALVKCRKVGAANWGNSAKNEEYMALPEFTDAQIGAMRYAGIEVEVIDEKCWKGYEKKGMKTMFGKRYPNCVKKEDEIKNDDKLISEKKGCSHTHEGEECPVHGKKACPSEPSEEMNEAMTMKAKVGQVISVHLSWRGKYINIKMFFPQMGLPNRKDVEAEIAKVYPGANVMAYKIDQKQPGEPMVMVGEEERLGKSSEVSEDWQKVNKSDKTDGMSKKAVAAYRRENPGSKLKTAVTGKVKAGSKDAKRRKSFCARSKGQQDMHNIDCSKTPDKPVCKARRRWKC